MRRWSRSPLAIASALARATTKAVLRTSAELVEEAAGGAGRALARGSVPATRTVGAARSLLVSEEAVERLRTADPTTMARAVLALVGGEELLGALPSPEHEIRQRFRALLDPETVDDASLAPALLTITAQLSADEARILRHIARTDRAVVVTVEAGSLTSRRGPTVAEHLSVLVERAGGAHPDRGPAYVANLLRLGLCTIDWEASGDHPDLALVEQSQAFRTAVAQLRSTGSRPRVRDGSLVLTALGRELLAIAIGPERRLASRDEAPPTPQTTGARPLPRSTRATVTRPVDPVPRSDR